MHKQRRICRKLREYLNYEWKSRREKIRKQNAEEAAEAAMAVAQVEAFKSGGGVVKVDGGEGAAPEGGAEGGDSDEEEDDEHIFDDVSMPCVEPQVSSTTHPHRPPPTSVPSRSSIDHPPPTTNLPSRSSTSYRSKTTLTTVVSSCSNMPRRC